MQYLIVNDRIPRADAYCALCCEKIADSYVREMQTRLLYCDAKCFAGHCSMAILAIEYKARAVS